MCLFFFKYETETDQVTYIIEETFNIAEQLHLKVDRNDVIELLDSHSKELPLNELMKIDEKIATNEADTSGPDPSEKKVSRLA
ncbi:hypothetical protein AVEN_219013-1 [Araneus ventricosus]|uniref:Uncharacterized protein n=1 Tax=Araneus ventricosus TaxID=182803 RepID=A0A4Y2CDR6_ARAVE|nr:hypothetical protein AVEN_219013-1 [Araneus ventricosus]